MAFVAMCVTVAFFTTNCNNDSFWGIDSFVSAEDSYANSTLDHTLFANYLSVSSGDVNKWSENDFISCNAAINRLGVVFSQIDQKYIYNNVSHEEINISESLYNYIIVMIERTNTILGSAKESRVVRVKTRSNESSGPLPDCVPAAVAHMGCSNAPSYSEAITKCDELFPGWRVQGGINIDSIEDLIEEYIPVTEHYNLNFCPSGVSTNLPNLVMVFAGHAVNAYRAYRLINTSVVYYRDYSSTSLGDSFILGDEMSRIYVFTNF